MSRARQGALALLSLALVLAGAGIGGAGAWAGTPGSFPGNGTYVGGLIENPGPEPLVLWNLPGAGLGTCITANANGPLRGPYSVGSVINDPVYAELNYLYAQPSTSDVQLGELSALNSHKYDEVDTNLQWGYVVNGAGGMSVADADAMLARATNLAGPYTVSFSGVPQHGQGDRANTPYPVTVQVISAHGTPVPDQVVSLSAAGATLGANSVTTDGSGAATVTVTVPSSNTTGSFSLSYNTDEHLSVNKMVTAGEQAMLSTGSPTTAAGSAIGGVDPQISIEWFKYTAGDPTKTPVAGAVFSTVVDQTLNATVATNLVSTTSPQTLTKVIPGDTLVWTETKAPAGDYVTGPITVTIPANATNGYQIGLANPKIPVPTISTAVQLAQTQTGVQLLDHATVAGDDGENGTITDKLYSVPVPAAGTCTGITDAGYLAGTLTGTYLGSVNGSNGNNGNGTYTISGPTPATAGCYHWFESIVLTPSGASSHGTPSEGSETTLVTSPTAHTLASEQYGMPGDTVVDTIPVTGITQVPTSTSPVGVLSAATYFLPYQSPTQRCADLTEAQWSAYIAAGTAKQVSVNTWSLTKDTTERTTGYRVPSPGCVSWLESYLRTGATTPVVLSPAGSANEVTAITSPVVSTLISSSTSVTGATVSFTDQAKITGTHGVPTTLVDLLVGPAAPDAQGICTHAQYNAGTIAGAFTPVTVSSDETVTTNTLSIASPSAGPACYIGWESLTVGSSSGPRTVYTSPLGSETAEMALAQRRAAAAASSSALISAGGGQISRLSAGRLALGLGLLGAGLIVSAGLWRQQRRRKAPPAV